MSATVRGEPAANKTIVTRFFAALTRGDYARAARLATTDATWWSLTQRETRPLAATLERIAQRAADLPDGLSFTVGWLTAEEDRISALAESHAKFADGRVYDNRYHFLFRFRSGRIAAVWEYHDTAHANQVLRGH
jgi:uncharacterized protein